MHGQEHMVRQRFMPAQGANAPGSGKRRLSAIISLTATGLVLLLAGWAAKHFFRSSPRDDAQAHWQEAQKEIAERQFVDAGAHLLQCLESWPLNAEVHFLTARTARRAGQLGPWQVH